MTAWTEHLKAYAKKNNTTYGCAMGDPKAKEEYYKKNPKKTKEQKKQKQKEDESERFKKTYKSSLSNFKKNFVKPYLKEKDGVLLGDMKRKYNKFSQGLKDYIKKETPNIHNLVSREKVESKKPQAKPKAEKPKAEKPKPKAEKPKPKAEKFFYSEEKIEEANSDIEEGQKFYDYIAKLMKEFNKSPNKKLKKEIEHYIKSIKKKLYLNMDEFTLEMEGVTDNYVDVFKKYKSTKKKLK